MPSGKLPVPAELSLRDGEQSIAMQRTPPVIVHIIFRLDTGGLENGLVNLINAMPASAYRHVIICLKDYSDFRLRISRADVSVYALHKRDGKDPAFYIRLWRLLRRLRPAIVHTRNLTTLDCVVVAALAGVRRRIHGEHGWDMIDLHGNSRKYNLLRRACRPLVEHYIAVSRDLGYWLRNRIGVPTTQLTQIYNGVDSVKFHPASAGREPLPEAQFAADTLVIGTVGRMQQVKDPLNLVRAFIHLLNVVPNGRSLLRLVMVGDGALLAQAKTLLAQADAAQLAWLPGERSDIAELLRGMDIFVLPSLNEGISNTILEAMASALPVIATEVGGNPELVTEGRTGVLVPAANPQLLAAAILNYVDNPQLQRRHGLAARARVEAEFSLDAMVKRYQQVYDQPA